jgi:hypothetical protein
LPGPRVETRGYFLASLTGLTLGVPLVSGLNPGLFSVAPSGLQEWGHNVAALGIAHPLPHVGAAPRGCPPVGTGTRSRAACELSPAGTKENSPGLQLANPRRAYIGFRQGQEKTGFAPRVNRVPQGRKKIAPGFNPGINVAPRSSPVGTTESALDPRCIWDHIRSRAV